MRRLPLLITTVALTACATDRLAGPDGSEAAAGPLLGAAAPASELVVMSRNMYVGAPVEPILAADPADVPFRVAEAWATLVGTDFPTRARGMAAEIRQRRPHLIGLQEVSLLRTQFPSDVVLGNLTPNATDVAYDFLTTLLAELESVGLDYVVGAVIENTDVEVPRFDGIHPDGYPLFTDVRLTDYDVVLVRADVPWGSPAAANYSVSLPAPAGIDVLRGWTAVDATVGGVSYRFVNTHLEAEAEIVRYYQAAELMTILASETRPVVLVGDLNTGPGRPTDQGGQATYDFILGFGFTDAWDARRPDVQSGFSCCHAGDLSNRVPALSQRIDHVLVRGGSGILTNTWLTGNTTGDFSRWGVWPSDHAGMVARWTLPRAMAVR
jgi:endonuclease/exonuclease/phosphatase family metal-dependent hydrolase